MLNNLNQKKMKKSILIPLSVALLCAAVSCNKDFTSPACRGGSEPIGFSAYSGLTKVTDLTTANLTDFGVYAFHSVSGNWTTDLAPNFMFDQKVQGSASAGFTYSPVKYWPEASTEKLSFFAYAPYKSSANGITERTDNKTKGYPSVRYTIPSKESDQVDLLWAKPRMNLTKSSGKIKFTFSHSLARLGFSLRSAVSASLAPETTLYLNEVTVKGRFVKAGTLNLGNGTWSELELGEEYSYTRNFGSGENGIEATGGGAGVTTGEGGIMIIPQNGIDLEVTVKYTVVTEDPALDGGKAVITNTVTTSTTVSGQQGSDTTLSLVLSPKEVTFDKPTVSVWTND